MNDQAKERVLLVDDDQAVLDGLCRQHRKHFDLHAVQGPEAALRTVAERGPFAVVVSDYQMPGMNGATFLARARELAPDMTRVMLTGQSDLATAVDAVNRGNIFRFLTKPCDPDLFRTVVAAGLDQYRLVNAERLVLEQTVQGAIGVLADVLSLAQPTAFGRSMRIHHYASHVADALRLDDAWQVKTAALLSQIGCVAVPNDILERVSGGEQLPADQMAMMERHPKLAADLLRRIPRLQGVAEIISALGPTGEGKRPTDPALRLGASILKAAVDYEELISMGARPSQALDALRKGSSRHEERILAALATARVEGRSSTTSLLSLSQLRPGMVLEEEIRSMESGMLLVPKGHVMTASSLERLRNYSEIGSLRTRTYRVSRPPREKADDEASAA